MKEIIGLVILATFTVVLVLIALQLIPPCWAWAEALWMMLSSAFVIGEKLARLRKLEAEATSKEEELRRVRRAMLMGDLH